MDTQVNECCGQCKAQVEGECRMLPPTVMWSDISECLQWAHPSVPNDHWCFQFIQKNNA
jgi:hypothetical protein